MKTIKVFFASCLVSFAVAFSIFMGAWSMVHHPEVFAVPAPRDTVVAEIYQIKDVKLTVTPLPPAMVYYDKPIELSDRDRYCLAKNVFYEAGVESLQGKLAVAHVTWNRVTHPKRWGNTVCSAVYRKNQFSWTNNPNKRNKRPHGPLWRASLEAVDMFVQGARVKQFDGVYYYHADYVSPSWTKKLKTVTKIGAHIFYRYNI